MRDVGENEKSERGQDQEEGRKHAEVVMKDA